MTARMRRPCGVETHDRREHRRAVTMTSPRMKRRVFGTITPRHLDVAGEPGRRDDVDVRAHRRASRATCCRISATPNVTSSVSSGRSYIRRSSSHSSSDADQPAGDERDGQRQHVRSGGGPREEADLRLQHVRRVGAGHDELAVGHVDHAHLAEREASGPSAMRQQDRRRWLIPLKTCSDRNVSIGRLLPVSTLACGQARGPVVVGEARVGLDRPVRRPHLVDQTVGVDLADAGRLGDVLVPVVDGDRALRRRPGPGLRRLP